MQSILIIVLVVATGVICVKLPGYYANFKAATVWRQATAKHNNGNTAEALIQFKTIYSQLQWNGRFLYHYGNTLMKQGTYQEAIACYESGKTLLPFSSLYENLGMAYLAQASITNDVNITEEYYRRADSNLRAAAAILPWRITPRYNLAYLHYRCGHTNKVLEYASQIIEMPMKKYNPHSIAMKQEAKKYLLHYGYTNVFIFTNVFNIYDRSMWNEGKW